MSADRGGETTRECLAWWFYSGWSGLWGNHVRISPQRVKGPTGKVLPVSRGTEPGKPRQPGDVKQRPRPGDRRGDISLERVDHQTRAKLGIEIGALGRHPVALEADVADVGDGGRANQGRQRILA